MGPEQRNFDQRFRFVLSIENIDVRGHTLMDVFVSFFDQFKYHRYAVTYNLEYFSKEKLPEHRGMYIWLSTASYNLKVSFSSYLKRKK